MNTLSQAQIDEINDLSIRIDNNTAEVSQYEHYETLLLKAGVEKEQIRSKMTTYGYNNYNQYLEARKRAVTKEQRRVVNVIIVAGLVVLSAFVGILIASGRLVIKRE